MLSLRLCLAAAACALLACTAPVLANTQVGMLQPYDNDHCGTYQGHGPGIPEHMRHGDCVFSPYFQPPGPGQIGSMMQVLMSGDATTGTFQLNYFLNSTTCTGQPSVILTGVSGQCLPSRGMMSNEMSFTFTNGPMVADAQVITYTSLDCSGRGTTTAVSDQCAQADWLFSKYASMNITFYSFMDHGAVADVYYSINLFRDVNDACTAAVPDMAITGKNVMCHSAGGGMHQYNSYQLIPPGFKAPKQPTKAKAHSPINKLKAHHRKHQ